MNAKWFSHFGRQFLTKLNIVVPYDPAVMLHGIYSTDLKTYIHLKIYMQIFGEDLLIIAKKWNQPRHSSIVECINKQYTSKEYMIERRGGNERIISQWRHLTNTISAR